MAYKTTISPVCVSCQTQIGHIYTLYSLNKDNQLQSYLDKTGYKFDDNSTIEIINMKDFLDKNGIDNICCRTAILGHILVTQGTQ